MANLYSIWLKPSGNTYSELMNIISQLSKKYSSPIFEPHVTLIGGLADSEVNVISRTSKLANLLKPITIRLMRIGYLNEFFRCLFITVEESDSLMSANLTARKIFNRLQDPKFIPHLSLLYGIFNSSIKEEIIADIGKKFEMNFEIKSIRVVSTKNEPKDWYETKEFILK